MGGDHAPVETVHGAIAAAAAGVDVVLVGAEDALHAELTTAGADIQVVAASEVITMDDDPARAIREKKDASVTVAARLVASGDADGFVSAGSTGAALAAASFVIGRVEGCKRPAIASVFPTRKIVLDSGANLECRPEHLAQFGIMGSALAETYLGIEAPKVGLLNIGGETGKGRDLERRAFDLLDLAPIRFVGNVEGHDLLGDGADVIVTDGFTGNVLLKGSEGTARMMLRLAYDEVGRFDGDDEADSPLGPALAMLRSRLDPESYGGAHLVGTNGVVVIAHGSSSRVAVANALKMASADAGKGLVDRVASGLRNHDGGDAVPE